MVLIREEQRAHGRLAKFLQQLTAHLRHGIDAGERGACFVQTLQPGIEMGGIGQRREQQFFVLALVFLVTQRNCRHQR